MKNGSNTRLGENYTAQFLVDGFILDCQARRLSPHTISDYTNTYTKFINYIGEDVKLCEIANNLIRGFLAKQNVSNKTLLNYYTGLSVLFKFAVSENYLQNNPMVGIRRPKAEIRAIQPIPEEDIRKMLNVKSNKVRNRALILLLLDTGIRVSELCGIKLSDINIHNKTVKIFGKNNKERVLYYSATTAQALWKFIANSSQSCYLFTTKNGVPFNRGNVTAILRYICKLCAIPQYSPHDFRHTFAINFLRNYPNIYALQYMLGHSSLDMVKRYLVISEFDIAMAQNSASPVEHWRL